MYREADKFHKKKKAPEKTLEEIEFEKNKDEFTFQPNKDKSKLFQKIAKKLQNSIKMQFAGKKDTKKKSPKKAGKKEGLNKEEAKDHNANPDMEEYSLRNHEHSKEAPVSSKEEVSGNEENPLLFVDAKLGNGKKARIILYEGDDPEDVAKAFAERYSKYYKRCL